MPKVKGKIVPAWSGSLARHRSRYSPIHGAHITFRMLGGEGAICERVIPKQEPTEAQLLQRWLYREVECMLRNMTVGQALTWKRFYWYARSRGWTVKHSHRGPRATEVKDTKKNMGYRAFFFSRGLRWMLSEWFYRWLKMKWRFETYTETEDMCILEVKLVHRDLRFIPTEPREYKVERIRF